MTTERDVSILAGTTDGVGAMVLQASNIASKMNNRLYRQARDYDVKFRVISGSVSTSSLTRYDFYTLPNTWFVKGAIRHAYKTYQQMMADELAQGIKPARWHDFSINEQNPDAVWDYAFPALFDGDGWGLVGTPDESITDSSVTDSGGTSKGFHLIGNLANSFNIFREYAKFLNYRVPDSEAVSSDQPYDGLLDLDDADVLAERGDRAPYDRDFNTFLPADTTVDDDQSHNLLVFRDSCLIDANSAHGKMVTKTFTAPLGLVWCHKYVESSLTDFSTSTPEISLELASGDYKGLRSHSLTE